MLIIKHQKGVVFKVLLNYQCKYKTFSPHTNHTQKAILLNYEVFQDSLQIILFCCRSHTLVCEKYESVNNKFKKAISFYTLCILVQQFLHCTSTVVEATLKFNYSQKKKWLKSYFYFNVYDEFWKMYNITPSLFHAARVRNIITWFVCIMRKYRSSHIYKTFCMIGITYTIYYVQWLCMFFFCCEFIYYYVLSWMQICCIYIKYM